MTDFTAAPLPIQLPNFNNVAAGGKPTIAVPAQGVYYKIVLQYTESGTLVTQANMEAAITKVTQKINGIPVREETAREIIDRNARNGITYSNGFLELFYAEPWQRNADLEDSLRWGMNDVQTFQIEVEIASGRTSPALEAYALHKDLAGVNLGLIKKVRKFTIPSSGTGDITYTGIPTTEPILAIHGDLAANSVVVDDFRVVVNSKIHMNLTSDQNTQLQTSEGKSPNSDYLHIDFTYRDRHVDGLTMVTQGAGGALEPVQDLRLITNQSTGGALPLLVETLAPVSR